LAVSAPDVIGLAFEHTKAQLLRPFRFSQWWRLAVVGLFAGELGSGGGSNFSTPSSGGKHPSNFLSGWPPSLHDLHPQTITIIAVGVVVGLAALVLLTYISSVMRFILFDSVIAKECHISEGWRRRTDEGWRYFCWQLGFLGVTLAAILILIGTPVAWAWANGWFAQARAHLAGLILGGIVVVGLFLALVLVAALVQVLTKDFVVPQMALEGLTAVEGWRRLAAWIKAEKGQYAGYIGIKIGLGLAAAIIIAVLQIVALLVMLIPIGGIAAAIYLGAKSAGMTWDAPAIALAVVLGIIVLLLVFFVLLLIATPTVVFFPAYSMYFLAPRYAPLAARLWPQPPASQPAG